MYIVYVCFKTYVVHVSIVQLYEYIYAYVSHKILGKYKIMRFLDAL